MEICDIEVIVFSVVISSLVVGISQYMANRNIMTCS